MEELLTNDLVIKASLFLLGVMVGLPCALCLLMDRVEKKVTRRK